MVIYDYLDYLPGEKGLGNTTEAAEFPFYDALLRFQHILLSM